MISILSFAAQAQSGRSGHEMMDLVVTYDATFPTGGSIDLRLTPRLAFRAIRAEYLCTQLPNGQTNVQVCSANRTKRMPSRAGLAMGWSCIVVQVGCEQRMWSAKWQAVSWCKYSVVPSYALSISVDVEFWSDGPQPFRYAPERPTTGKGGLPVI